MGVSGCAGGRGVWVGGVCVCGGWGWNGTWVDGWVGGTVCEWEGV